MSQADGTPLTRVRTTKARLSGLIREGLDRSATFRQLVAGLETTDLVVYIEAGRAGRAIRYVRITVPATEGNRARLIARIGHELQHAHEVAAAPSVVDESTLLKFYAKLDTRAGHGDRAVETDAAVRAESLVFKELSAAR